MSVCIENKTCIAEQIQSTQAQQTEGGGRICFVCTGNTCRSPMASAVASFYAKKTQEAGKTCRLEISSAGLYAVEGDPITAQAVAALEEAGILPTPERDFHAHRAHTLTGEEVERADLLVGMSGSHCMELLMRYPEAAQKITCMPHPISDPFGGDLDVYRTCLEQITEGVVSLLFSTEWRGDGEVDRA